MTTLRTFWIEGAASAHAHNIQKLAGQRTANDDDDDDDARARSPRSAIDSLSLSFSRAFNEQHARQAAHAKKKKNSALR
jgi:hypothetical protein